MKRIISLGIVLMLLTAIAGCIPAGETGDQRGNTTGNIANGGLLAAKGDWVYYRSEADGWKLYKGKPDGSGKVKLRRCAMRNQCG